MNRTVANTETMRSADWSIRMNWRTVLWISLFLFILFSRFHDLGDKPFHHDESLYAKYIWNFHVGQGYEYDPMQHGPFMFHASQVTLFLFGVTNYTVRILPALTGIALFFLLFFARNLFPKDLALFSGWLFAINPVFMYFQRFLRHDAFFSLFSIMVLIFIIAWLKTRQTAYVYATAASLSILFCIKENAFVTLLILFTFAFFKILCDMFIPMEDGKKPGLKAVSMNMSRYPMLTKVIGFISLWGFSFVAYALLTTLEVESFARNVHTYWYFIFALFIIYAIVIVLLGEKARSGEPDRKIMGLPAGFFYDGHIFALGLLIFIGIFILLYTTFFTNFKNGFWGGIYEWFEYWLHQHSIARIRGPFHYYHHQMLIYAFIPLVVVFCGGFLRVFSKAGVLLSVVFLALWGVLYGFAAKSGSAWWFTKEDLFTNEHMAWAIGVFIAGAYCTYTYLREKLFLRAILMWWTVLAYLIYSYLQEKVPWLTMHIITPMIFLAALMLLDVFKDTSAKFRRNTLIAVFSIMVAYSLHTSVWLCWHNEADPTEQMVYVQTTYEVLDIIDELEAIGFWTNQGTDVPILIDGHATWPFYWYLRDWKGVSYGRHVNPDKHLAVICNWESRHEFANKMDGRYVARRYGLRAWYLPKRNDLTKGNQLKEIWRWMLLRERFKPSLYGTQDVCMFVRNDVAAREWSEDIGQAPAKPERKEPARKETTVKESKLTFGRFGSSKSQFNEPKDIAVSSAGEIYVVDNKNHRIQKFDADGNFVTAWGTYGKGEGQFDKPTGIGIDSRGNVFVADTWNHRIQKFDADGEFILTFGDSREFWAPKDVIIDKDGDLYIANTGYHRIDKYSGNGRKQWSVGQKGSGPTEFTEPVGVALDRLNRVYVCDTANKRISLFDKDGHLLKSYPVFGWDYYYTEPYIALDERNGNIYISDSRNNRLQVLTLDGNLEIFMGKEGGKPGEFKLPTGVDVANGNLYVVDSGNSRVQVFDLLE